MPSDALNIQYESLLFCPLPFWVDKISCKGRVFPRFVNRGFHEKD